MARPLIHPDEHFPHQKAVYFAKRPALLGDLYIMGDSLGQETERTQTERKIYLTTYSTRVDTDWDTIRTGLATILSGNAAFPMNVVSFPSDPETLKAQAEYMQLIAQSLPEGKSSPIQIMPPDKTGHKGSFVPH